MRMPNCLGYIYCNSFSHVAFPALLVSSIMMTLDKVLGTSFFMPTILKAGEVLEYGGGLFFFNTYFGFLVIPRYTL